MKVLSFKTNISCSGCVSAISPYFKRSNKFESWKVDLNHSDKILTVTGKDLQSAQVIRLVEEAGFIIKGEVK